MAALCVTCNEKPAVRLQVGSVDGPYWCSDECKRRWMFPRPADLKEPAGDGTPIESADLSDAYEQVMRKRG